MTTMTSLRALLPETRVGALLTGGLLVLGIGFGGMGAWAALAPLHSAVIAPGALVPETGRKVVKHTDGGIIGEILVREGDTVKAGDVLLRLDPTEAQTRLEVLTSSWLEAMALEARLSAELFDQPDIDWPDTLRQRQGADPMVSRLMENQRTLFDVRRQQLATEQRILEERIASLAEEVRSLEEQRRFLAREIQLIEEDLKITQSLLEKGNATRTKLVEQQKEEAKLKGRDRELEARVAQIRQQSAEASGELTQRRNDFREKVLTDLEKARGEVSKLAEQIRDAANRLANRDVKSPESGSVVMHGHLAVGGVITPGEAILDVVPEERDLLAEVHVATRDIKSVVPDLPVKVTITAYNSRIIGKLDGRVEYVSADRITNAQTRQEYYLVRIRLNEGGAHEVKNLTIKAGMPVEASILLSERTPLDYLISPLTQSYLKAFVQE